MSYIQMFVISALLAFNASAKEISNKDLSEALAHLRTTDFTAGFSKKIHDVMDNDAESSGDIYFSKGKMRLEQEQPEKTLLVYDGTFAWQETEFDDKKVVTKIKNVKKSSALLAALLGDQDILINFKLIKETKRKTGNTYDLIPKNPKITEVKKLHIVFDGQKLRGFRYTDNLENTVEYLFKKLKEGDVSEKKFKYEPPKGAEMSEV